jgi:hypothetical protein
MPIFGIVATALESFGDATIRIALFNRCGAVQAAPLSVGLLLFGYDALLNLAPVEF